MRPKIWQVLFWPPVNEPEYRKSAIWWGAFIVFFYAIGWGLIMLVGLIMGAITQSLETVYTGLKATIPFLLGSLIGWGILKKSRAVALAGLGVGFSFLIINLSTEGLTIHNLVINLIAIYILIHSTRGIFAHHRTGKELDIVETTQKV